MNKVNFETVFLYVTYACPIVAFILGTVYGFGHFIGFLISAPFAYFGYLSAQDWKENFRQHEQEMTGANLGFYWFLICVSIACGAFALVELVRSF